MTEDEIAEAVRAMMERERDSFVDRKLAQIDHDNALMMERNPGIDLSVGDMYASGLLPGHLVSDCESLNLDVLSPRRG